MGFTALCICRHIGAFYCSAHFSSTCSVLHLPEIEMMTSSCSFKLLVGFCKFCYQRYECYNGQSSRSCASSQSLQEHCHTIIHIDAPIIFFDSDMVVSSSVISVSDVVRIRTGESGKEAERMTGGLSDRLSSVVSIS